MRFVYLITVVSIALVATSTATASTERCSHEQSARRELVCAQRALRSRRGEEHWIVARKSRTLFARTTAHYWRTHLRFVRWRIRVERRVIARARARLHAELWGGSAHQALWLCIHSREGAWNDQGAPYYGGLQMTYGWGGLVVDAGNLSPAAQMRAAEIGYRRSGYSRAWLAGQWPHTSPPCLQYA